jgi:non-specific serine/threonine protein kinase
VLVHKFICRGTIEERIDAMLESKQGLSDTMLASGDEIRLTEMTDDALLRLMALDLTTALAE